MNWLRFRRPSRFRRNDGVTLVETTIGMGLVGLFLTGLMLARTNMVGLLQRAKENAAASQVLQQRVEESRIANWVQITDAAWLSVNLMAKASESAANLTAPVETVTVASYPAVTGETPAKIVRKDGAATVVSSNTALKDARMVRINVDLTWTGVPGKRARARSTSVIVAKGGISK